MAPGLPRSTRAMFASNAAQRSAGVANRSRGRAVVVICRLLTISPAGPRHYWPRHGKPFKLGPLTSLHSCAKNADLGDLHARSFSTDFCLAFVPTPRQRRFGGRLR